MVGLMTAEELAVTLAVSPETVNGWARDGVIPAVNYTEVDSIRGTQSCENSVNDKRA